MPKGPETPSRRRTNRLAIAAVLALLAPLTAKAGALFDCELWLTDPDLVIAPAWPGTKPEYPKGLPETPENRMLFGAEGEFGPDVDFSNGDGVPAMNDSTRNLLKFYVDWDGQPPPIEKLKKSLKRLGERDPGFASLSEPEKAMLKYLPESTTTDAFPFTQEIVSPILPNRGTFRAFFRNVVRRIGGGSYQGMISVPRKAILAHGKDEMTGLTLLANELAAMASLDRVGGSHPFLSPFNAPILNSANGRRGNKLLSEMDAFFESPDSASSLKGKEMSNPKFTRGLAPRFDFSNQYVDKSRFFFEIRGCQGNPVCVEKWMSYVVRIFKRGIRGFDRFAGLGPLVGEPLTGKGFGGDPWRMTPAWTALDVDIRRGIKKRLRIQFAAAMENGMVDQHVDEAFFYPLKDWATAGPAMGMDALTVRKVLRAQSEYLAALERASHLAPRDAIVAALAPAMRKFKDESGLHEFFLRSWERIVGIPFDVRY